MRKALQRLDGISRLGKRETEPVRMCVFCRRRYPKRHLVRFVMVNGQIKEDKAMRLPGRGAYVCRDKKCFERAGRDKKGVLKKALKII